MTYADPQRMSYLVERSEQRTAELRQAADRSPTLAERQTWRIMLRAALMQQRDYEKGAL